MDPIAKLSALKVIWSSFNISGAIKLGVPTMNPLLIYSVTLSF